MKLSIKNLAIVGAVIAAIAGGIWLAKPSEASVCDGWINVITCGTPSHQDQAGQYAAAGADKPNFSGFRRQYIENRAPQFVANAQAMKTTSPTES